MENQRSYRAMLVISCILFFIMVSQLDSVDAKLRKTGTYTTIFLYVWHTLDFNPDSRGGLNIYVVSTF